MPLEWKRYSRCDIVGIEDYLNRLEKVAEIKQVQELLRTQQQSAEVRGLLSEEQPLYEFVVVPAVEGQSYVTNEIKENNDWWDLVEFMENYFISDRYVRVKNSDHQQGKERKEKRIIAREKKKTKSDFEKLSEVTKDFLKSYGLPFKEPQRIIDTELTRESVREDNEKASKITYEIEEILYKASGGNYIPTLQTMASLFNAYIRDTGPVITNFCSLFDEFRLITIGSVAGTMGHENSTIAGVIPDETNSDSDDKAIIVQGILDGKSADDIFYNGISGKPKLKKLFKNYTDKHLVNLVKSLHFQIKINIDHINRPKRQIFPVSLAIQADNLWTDMVLRILESSQKGLELRRCENCTKMFTANRTNQKFCSRKGKKRIDVGCKRKYNLKAGRAKRRGTPD